MKDIVFRTVMLKGEKGATIESIEKISAEGGVMQMRINLSDGTSQVFPVNDVPDTELINDLIEAAVSGMASTVDDLATTIRATLLASEWSDSSPYTLTISESGVTIQDNYEIVGFDPSGTAEENYNIKEALGFITYGYTGAGTITFYAVENKPTVDIPIILRKVVG